MADTAMQAALRAAFNSKVSVNAQSLTTEQQAQARANIGAISSAEVPAPDLSGYAPLASPAFTGSATLNGQPIATTDQISAGGDYIPLSGNAGVISSYETAEIHTPQTTGYSETYSLTENSPSVVLFTTTSSDYQSYVVYVNCVPAETSVSSVKVLLFANGSKTLVLSINGATWANDGNAPSFGSYRNSYLIVTAQFINGKVYLYQSNIYQSTTPATSSG